MYVNTHRRRPDLSGVQVDFNLLTLFGHVKFKKIQIHVQSEHAKFDPGKSIYQLLAQKASEVKFLRLVDIQ